MVFDQITQTVNAIVAGGCDSFRSGSSELVGLDFGRFQTPGSVLRHRHSSASAGTAETLGTIGVHLAEISNHQIQQLTWFFVKAAASSIVA
jgi:hypothetical protein